jgi:hypothetical protein
MFGSVAWPAARCETLTHMRGTGAQTWIGARFL